MPDPSTRPRTRDAGATKARILEAAAAEFAAKGISGARIDDIAERAQTNKRMLYYYFGSKEALFREVLQRELTARIEMVSRLPADRVTRLVERQAHHSTDRTYVRLLQWEALEAPEGSPQDAERQQSFRRWVDAVAADQRAGRIVDGLDPAQLVLSELALTLMPAAFPQLTRWITGLAPDDPAFLEARQEFLLAFAERFFVGQRPEVAPLAPEQPPPTRTRPKRARGAAAKGAPS